MTTILKEADGLATPLPARYTLLPISARQPRLNGRMALRPDLDFSSLRCSAKIDTAKIRCRLTTSVRRWVKVHIEDVIGDHSVFVGQIGDDPTDALITIQNPTVADLLALERVKSLVPPLLLDSLEVAVDFRLRNTGLTEADHRSILIDVVGVLARHVMVSPKLHPEGSNPRCYVPREFVSTISGATPSKDRFGKIVTDGLGRAKWTLCAFSSYAGAGSDLDELLGISTYYLKHEDSPVGVRIYRKDLDGVNDGVGRPLPKNQWSARFELIHEAKALRRIGVEDVASLKRLDFTKLLEDFAFRAPTVNVAPTRGALSAAVRRRANVGMCLRFKYGGVSLARAGTFRGCRAGRKFSRLVEFSALRDPIYQALYRLTRRR